MQPVDIVSSINQVFSENDATTIIAALRQDELVWNAVQDATLAVALAQNPKPDVSSWSPAAIFCLSESLPKPEDLKNLSLGIEGTTRQQAILAYEKIGREGITPQTFQQAGYAALAFRERRKLVKSWDNLADEIQQDTSDSNIRAAGYVGKLLSPFSPV